MTYLGRHRLATIRSFVMNRTSHEASKSALDRPLQPPSGAAFGPSIKRNKARRLRFDMHPTAVCGFSRRHSYDRFEVQIDAHPGKGAAASTLAA